MGKQKPAKMKFVDSGGSLAGWHFFNTYENCQYKFLMRYLFGWKPLFSTPALVNGSATHYGKEIFYTDKGRSDKKRLQRAQEAYIGYMSAFRKTIKPIDLEDFEKKYSRGVLILEKWADEYGFADVRRYDVLAVEKEVSLPIKWRSKVFYLTGKMDFLGRDKEDGVIDILDTKTTSFSIKEVELACSLGDQATAYICMARKLYPKSTIRGFTPDIMYWHDATKEVDRATCKRPPPVTRNEEEIRQFLLGTGSLIAEVSAKAAAFKAGKGGEPGVLFRRNASYCHAFFKECEYAPYCKNNAAYEYHKQGKIPFDYTKDKVKVMERVIGGKV